MIWATVYYLHRLLLGWLMASAKTSSFWLTEKVNLSASGTFVSDSIDLGSYVDVADRQGISVEQIDFIFQSLNSAGDVQALSGGITANTEILAQLTDINQSALVGARSNSLVGSGHLLFNPTTLTADAEADMYPDNYGKTSDGRIVINDQMYLGGVFVGTLGAGDTLDVVVRIKCKVVKLSQADWMAIAIQSTAADN